MIEHLKPSIQHVIPERKKQEFQHLGSIRQIKGHTLYEFNYMTWDLVPVKVQQEVMIGFNKKAKHKTKVYQNEHCIYFQALNDKNAEKKATQFLLKMKANMEADNGTI